MSFLDTVEFQQTEERVKKYIWPRRIVLTEGLVQAPTQLLRPKDLQIDLNEPLCAVLKNRDCPRKNTAVLLDFGFEFHGGLRLLTHWVKGPSASAGNTLADTLVRLSFGESVSEALAPLGDRGACNDHATRVMTVNIPTLSDLEFGQTGFRFVYIELLSPGTEWALKAAVGAMVYRDIPYRGNFSCSDPLLNRIYDVAAYTCHLNLQTMLWDGIKRDRLVWVGDTHPEMLTIRTVFGKNKTLEDSLWFAHKKAPLPQYMNGMPSYSLWWLLIIHDYYLATGDRDFINHFRRYALALIQQIADLIDENGEHTLPAYFLDWPTNETPAARAGVHGLLVLTMRAAADLASWYGNVQIKRMVEDKIQLLARHCPDCHGAKQALAMQALAGLRDMAETGRQLVADGAKGMSTFMSYYILKVMSSHSMTDALRVLRDYYGGMLSMGATTFWEDFNIDWLQNAAPIDAPVPAGKDDLHGDFGAFCYKGFRHSLCHGWSSGPVPFLAERVLGIQLHAPGCKKIIIKPDLGDLDWARGDFPTPMGNVHVEVTRQPDGSVKTTYTAPAGLLVLLEG